VSSQCPHFVLNLECFHSTNTPDTTGAVGVSFDVTVTAPGGIYLQSFGIRSYDIVPNQNIYVFFVTAGTSFQVCRYSVLQKFVSGGPGLLTKFKEANCLTG
jgi:hypothetical protein